MLSNKTQEKKVEYLELIYDLIFVYMIGRNNQLLHITEGGFVSQTAFLSYVLCTLAIIQIWNFSTCYINLYGRNGIRDHVFMLINMFLLYFMGQGTRQDWQAYQPQYHIAWALILINIGVQYLIERRNHSDEPHDIARTTRMGGILLGEALIVLMDIPLFQHTGMTWLSAVAIAFGIAMVMLVGQRGCPARIDFAHLSERAMLYVVFTFGEMIIAVSVYFDGKMTGWTFYFALMAFLIAVGLFLSYEVLYDHLINREQMTNGLGYMATHILIIFALNGITAGLEFMHEEEMDLAPKMIFMMASLILYYVGLLMLGRYAKKGMEPAGRSLAGLTVSAALFAVLMALTRGHMAFNIAVTVAFVFLIALLIRRYVVRPEDTE